MREISKFDLDFGFFSRRQTVDFETNLLGFCREKACRVHLITGLLQEKNQSSDFKIWELHRLKK